MLSETNRCKKIWACPFRVLMRMLAAFTWPCQEVNDERAIAEYFSLSNRWFKVFLTRRLFSEGKVQTNTSVGLYNIMNT